MYGMNLLSDRIHVALHRAGLKQAELARLAGVSRQTINDWTHDRAKNIRGANLLAACKVLGVRPEWLASGKGEMLPEEGSIPLEYEERVEHLIQCYLRADEKGKLLIEGVADQVGAQHPSPLDLDLETN
jgi:transcriptional regulator with XRE-family HTH domain